MSDISSSINRYAGIIVPHWALRTPAALWAAESSFTENGARAGVPEDQGASETVLVASGSQSSGGQIRLQGHAAGYPGVPGQGTAGIVWRNEGDARWRGRDLPSVMTHHEFVHWTDGIGVGTSGAIYPHALTLRDETVVLAYRRRVGAGSYRISVSRRAPNTGTWSTVDVYTFVGVPTHDPYPCLVLLPNGRLLLFHWIEGSISTDAQIRLHYSDDDGDTWNVGSRYCLQSAIDTSGSSGSGAIGYDIRRIRAVYHDGQICLVAWLAQHDTDPVMRDVLVQYVSDDLGGLLRIVGSIWDGASGNGGALQELLIVDGQIMLLYHLTSGIGLTAPSKRIIGAASENFIDAARETINNPMSTGSWSSGWYDFSFTAGPTNILVTDGDFAAIVDRDGLLYIVWRRAYVGAGGLNQVVIGYSWDGGVSWDRLGNSDINDGKIWDAADASTFPRDFVLTVCQGRICLAHNHDADPGNEDNSLGIMYLGGSTTVTMPTLVGPLTPVYQTTWQFNWLPFDLPGDCSWTDSAGAGTATLSDGALRLTTSANERSFYRSPAGTPAEGAILRVRLQVVSGGLLIGDDCAVRVRLADGTNDYDVSIRFTTLGYSAFDNNNGGTQIGSSQSVVFTGAAGAEVLLGVNDGQVSTWHRVASSASDREFFAGIQEALTNDTATPNANNRITWGHIGNGTVTSDWLELHYGTDEYIGAVGLADGQANPDDLYPLHLGAEGVYLDDGVSIAANSGPLLQSETWHLDARADYEIERIWPSVRRSPREGWRSVDDSAQVTIALSLDAAILGTDEGLLGSDVLGVALIGINFRDFYVEGYEVGTGWVSLATVDSSSGLSGLRWARSGSQLGVDGAAGSESTSTPYLIRQEFVGGTFELSAGVLRKILANSGGLWSNLQTTRRPVLHLEGVTGAEASTGTAGRIWAPFAAAVIQLKGQDYAGYRIRIPAQDTADGDFRIGSIVVGPVIALPVGAANGVAYTLEGGAEVVEASDRTETVREWAPPRRVIEYPLTELYPTRRVLASSSDEPPYWRGTTEVGGQPVALRHDGPAEIPGLLHQVAGERDPVVLLPAVLRQSTAEVEIINRQPLLLYARLSHQYRQEQILGEVWQDEVFRGESLVFTEIP